jgi:nucleoside-diphosphate-sugar epimerase
MKVLMLAGTGSMGTHLTSLLCKEGHDVFVTSRSKQEDGDQVKYLKGNAKDKGFLNEILKIHWDVIIDFMSYGTDEFKSRMDLLLGSAGQYVFISSARVYSQSNVPITEDTPRLLDVSTDEAYLKTDEYGLAKARQENLLRDSGRKNWTIIRPSITFSEKRLQLGVLEKEAWLYRALQGRSIVFSEDIANKVTTMTYGWDVAKGIASIVANPKASGEIYHITSKESFKWHDILSIYVNVLEQSLGKRPKVVITKKSTSLKFSKYQIIYSRYFDRSFDNKKINTFLEVDDFQDIQKYLQQCLESFLQKPVFLPINWRLEAINDRVAGEFTPLNEIPGSKTKMLYLAERFNVTFILRGAKKLRRFFN